MKWIILAMAIPVWAKWGHPLATQVVYRLEDATEGRKGLQAMTGVAYAFILVWIVAGFLLLFPAVQNVLEGVVNIGIDLKHAVRGLPPPENP